MAERKPILTRYINGNPIVTEFSSEDELRNVVNSISPNDEVLIARIFESEKQMLAGRDIIKDIYQTLKAQSLTQAQEADIINRAAPVLTALGFGFPRAAFDICNNLTIGGAFTQPRKTFLLNAINTLLI